ncbi:hypothetical protein K438DRAFT_1788094 [Mycena galopus ATCC 62051]|nr:hypothetical protein K438DRAFT_1788094 [Mycena galopus ATCC 62051]
MAHLKGLLERLEAFHIQEPNPQLESQLQTVVAAAQTEITEQQFRENLVNTDSHLPFLAIQIEGGSDSQDTFLDCNQSQQFGTPLTGVHPLEHLLDLFVWPEYSMLKEGKPVHDNKLEPAPAVKSASIVYFPQAPVYVLNSTPDPSYHCRWCYTAPFHTSD